MFQTPTTLKASKRQEKPLELLHIGSHIRYARYRRKLTPGETGKQIGVTGHSILNWERGESGPDWKTLPIVLRFLGYDPYPPPQTTLAERLLALRRARGWTLEEAGEAFGVASKTWWTWEIGKFSPLPLHRKLLETFLDSNYAEGGQGVAGFAAVRPNLRSRLLQSHRWADSEFGRNNQGGPNPVDKRTSPALN